jgi:hypothetical protein
MKMDASSKRFTEEMKTMDAMLRLYCKGMHGGKDGLCADCSELLEYSMERLSKCQFGADKPTCSKCQVHCYKPEMRERVKTVMRYSGPRMLKGSPLLALKHMMRSLLHKPRKA